jgi:hypothetical protein
MKKRKIIIITEEQAKKLINKIINESKFNLIKNEYVLNKSV